MRDESRRTREQEALRASEERFRLATEVASEAIWEWNLADDSVIWSRAYAGMFGESAAAAGTSSWWYEHLHPDDYHRVATGIREAITGQASTWEAEYRLRRADGGWASVIDRAVIVRDESCRAVRLIGAILDISIRTEALAKVASLNRDLRQKVAELEAVINTTPAGIAIAKDPQARHIRGNAALTRLLGVAPDDELSKTAPEGPRPARYRALRNGRELPTEQLPMQVAARGGTVTDVEIDILREDGQEVSCRASAAPLFDEIGRTRGAVGVFWDITELKRAQEELRRAKQELEQKVQARTRELRRANRTLRMVMECDQAIAHATDECGLVQAVCSILHDAGEFRMVWVGYAEQDEPRRVRPVASAGTEDGYLTRITVSWADNETGRGPTGTAIRSGRACVGLDFLTDPALLPWRQEALSRGYRSSIALPLFAAGRAFGALTLYSGVPEAFGQEEIDLLGELADDLAFGIVSMRAREERDQAYRSLEERTNQLRALAAEVVSAEERERRRLAQILHDHLQQLLAGARYGLESLREGATTNATRSAVGRIDRMLGECMEVSRSLTAELSPPVLHEAGLAAALEWLGLWYRKQHGLTVTLDVDESAAIAREDDRILMFQSVRELLFNVVKHARVKEARVSSFRGPEGRVQIEVSDDGIGFDPVAALARAGTAGGFGLFRVHERMAMFGGELRMESSPGSGSRFTLVSPPGSGPDSSPRKG
jgi:PAS domain S-box-containing protein